MVAARQTVGPIPYAKVPHLFFATLVMLMVQGDAQLLGGINSCGLPAIVAAVPQHQQDLALIVSDARGGHAPYAQAVLFEITNMGAVPIFLQSAVVKLGPNLQSKNSTIQLFWSAPTSKAILTASTPPIANATALLGNITAPFGNLSAPTRSNSTAPIRTNSTASVANATAPPPVGPNIASIFANGSSALTNAGDGADALFGMNNYILPAGFFLRLMAYSYGDARIVQFAANGTNPVAATDARLVPGALVLRDAAIGVLCGPPFTVSPTFQGGPFSGVISTMPTEMVAVRTVTNRTSRLTNVTVNAGRIAAMQFEYAVGCNAYSAYPGPPPPVTPPGPPPPRPPRPPRPPFPPLPPGGILPPPLQHHGNDSGYNFTDSSSSSDTRSLVERPAGLHAVIAALTTTAGAGAHILVLNELVRMYSNEFHTRLFFPRLTRLVDAGKTSVIPFPSRFMPFSWFGPVYRMTDETLLPELGIDATLHIGFIRLALKMIAITCTFDLSVLLWANVRGGGHLNVFRHYDLEILGIGNVANNKPLLWVHLISVMFKTYICLRLCNDYSKWMFRKQVLNLLDAGAGACDTYTVMLQDIPEDEDDDYLKAENRNSIAEVGPDGVSLEETDSEHNSQATRAAELDKESNRSSILLTPEQALQASKEAARLAMEASKDAAKKAAMETANATMEALRTTAEAAKMTRQLTQGMLKMTGVLEGPGEEPALIEHLAKGFKSFWGDQFADLTPIIDPTIIEKLALERDNLKLRMEHIKYLMLLSEKKSAKTGKPVVRPRHRLGFLGLFGESVDSLEWCRGELLSRQKRLADARTCVLTGKRTADAPLRRCAFVAFMSAREASMATQVQHTDDPDTWRVLDVTEPKGIFWPNVGKLNSMEKRMAVLTTQAATWTLCVFFMIPMVPIQALSTVSNLEQAAPFLRPLIEDQVVKSILEGVLPGMALLVFMALLPFVLRKLGEMEGCETQAELDVSQARGLFIFSAVNIFFGNVVAGSIIAAIKDLIEEPLRAVDHFALSIPQTSRFFMCFILLKAVAGNINLIEIVSKAVIYSLKTRGGLAQTPMAIADAWKAFPKHLGELNADVLLVFLLVLLISTMQPVIHIVGLIYFTVRFFVSKAQMMYQHEPEYDGQGIMWPMLRKRIVVSLIMYQFLLALLELLKGGIPQGVIILVVCVPATWLYGNIMDGRYNSVLRGIVPLKVFASPEFVAAERAAKQEVLPYLHPGLRPEPQTIDGVEVNPDSVIVAEVDLGWGEKKGPSPLGRGRSRRQQAQGNWRNLSSNVRKAIEAEEAEEAAAGSSPSGVTTRKARKGPGDGKQENGKGPAVSGANGSANASPPQKGAGKGPEPPKPAVPSPARLETKGSGARGAAEVAATPARLGPTPSGASDKLGRSSGKSDGREEAPPYSPTVLPPGVQTSPTGGVGQPRPARKKIDPSWLTPR